MGWFIGLITRESQDRAKVVYDNRVHLEEEDQSTRSMKLPLCAYSSKTSAAVGASVFLERHDKEQAEGGSQSRRAEPSAGRFTNRRGKPGSQKQGGRFNAQNLRNVGHVD